MTDISPDSTASTAFHHFTDASDFQETLQPHESCHFLNFAYFGQKQKLLLLELSRRRVQPELVRVERVSSQPWTPTRYMSGLSSLKRAK